MAENESQTSPSRGKTSEPVVVWHRSPVAPVQTRKPSRTHPLTVALVTFLLVSAGVYLFRVLSRPEEASPSYVRNGSFEQWFRNRPAEWIVGRTTVFDVPAEAIHGEHCLGMYSTDSVYHGVYQVVSDLDSTRTYRLYFSLRSHIHEPRSVGFELDFCGKNVRVSGDLRSGRTFHSGGDGWRQYSGTFSGATCVRILFFTSRGHVLLVDDVNLTEVP